MAELRVTISPLRFIGPSLQIASSAGDPRQRWDMRTLTDYATGSFSIKHIERDVFEKCGLSRFPRLPSWLLRRNLIGGLSHTIDASVIRRECKIEPLSHEGIQRRAILRCCVVRMRSKRG